MWPGEPALFLGRPVREYRPARRDLRRAGEGSALGKAALFSRSRAGYLSDGAGAPFAPAGRERRGPGACGELQAAGRAGPGGRRLGGRPLLGEMGKLLALAGGGLPVPRRVRLGPISRMDGFLEQLSAAISELRAYRHRPEGLAAVAELSRTRGRWRTSCTISPFSTRLRRLCRTAVSRLPDHPRPGL